MKNYLNKLREYIREKSFKTETYNGYILTGDGRNFIFKKEDGSEITADEFIKYHNVLMLNFLYNSLKVSGEFNRPIAEEFFFSEDHKEVHLKINFDPNVEQLEQGYEKIKRIKPSNRNISRRNRR